MAQKWNLQDIVPPDRRRQGPGRAQPPQQSPRRSADIRPSQAPQERPERITIREPKRESQQQYQEAAEAQDYSGSSDVDNIVARLEVEDGRLSRMRKYVFGGIIVAVILAAGFGVTILLSGAEVKIHPKMQATTVQATFTAKLKPAAGELGYELLTLEEEGERQVSATGKEDVKQQASGKITVYNAFSSTPQKLIKNTRFESPSGLIYKIPESISIPGYKKDAQGNITPGSITTTVFADSTGEAYNATDIRFTVPGLKGSEQYDKIYAETTKEGITGGFEGMKYVMDDAELATTKQKLDEELRNKLLSRVANERPNGFTTYDSSMTFSYESMPATDAGDNAAVIKERVRLYAPLFKSDDFAAFLAQNTIPGYDRAPVRIDDPNSMKFSYDPDLGGKDISSDESVSFKLSGPVTIVWQVDQEKLKKDLLGVGKGAAPGIFAKYPSINKAETVIRPIWKMSFPTDADKIKVTEVLEGN